MINRTELIKSIELMALITQTPISLLDAKGGTLFCPISEEHHYIPGDFSEILVDAYEFKNLPEHAPYIYLFSLQIMAGIIPISEDDIIVVGPVCITQCSLEHTSSAFSPMLSKEEIAHFYSLLVRYVPIDFFRFAGVLAQIANSNHGTSFTPSEVINFNFKREINVKPIKPTEFAGMSTTSISAIALFQQTMSSIITAGNIDALLKHWQSYVIDSIVGNGMPWENIDFFCIPFYTFMFQGALNGGVDIQLCFEKYSNQIERFKQANNMIECITELKRASYEYCNLVIESNRREYMPEVCSTCVSYINDHIQEKITVDDLSHLCGVHRNKLYEIFHAHYDMTISEYIEKERLRRAMVYLESSNYTLSEIASTMGYANQSHFTQIFKKHYGSTPGQYLKNKKSHRRNK